MRSETLFKIGNEIVLIEEGDLDLEVVETIKFMISEDCYVDFDDIEVEFIKGDDNLSDFEVNSNGKLIDYYTENEVEKVTFTGSFDTFLSFFDKNGEKIRNLSCFSLN